MEGRDSTAKAANVEKKKRSLFIYLLGKKGQQIYKTLTIKNAKGETIENDDEKKNSKWLSKHLGTTANP